ncbi:LPS translocon maturation chaperone LptM [Catenovulum maritimum]|uniref:LPS translocon maturation chaperone LptM n=1 Tax=Catenovulum maritimum TaxID=1513271 RepID=UPI000A441C23|nr:lipoprotein [Catenovulum maritimum]
MKQPKLVLAIIALVLLSACGQKGPLFIPEKAAKTEQNSQQQNSESKQTDK